MYYSEILIVAALFMLSAAIILHGFLIRRGLRQVFSQDLIEDEKGAWLSPGKSKADLQIPDQTGEDADEP